MTMPDAITSLKTAFETERSLIAETTALFYLGAPQGDLKAATDRRREARLAVSAAIEAVEGEIKRLRELLTAVLVRDAKWGLSGMPNDCGCIRLSHDAEREYETGKCPHQLARRALQETDR